MAVGEKINKKNMLTTILVIDTIEMTRKVVIFAQKETVKLLKDKVEMWEVFKLPLYNKLKEYRAKLGVNQQQMGTLVGTSRQTISQIERGDYSPSVTLALKIAKVCGVTVEDIFSYVDKEEEKDEE